MHLEAMSLGPEGGDILCALSKDCFEADSVEAWRGDQLRSSLNLPGVKARLFYEIRIGKDAGKENVGSPVGFWLGRFVLEEAELLLIATHRHYRRQGIGRKMVCDFIARAGKLGCDKAFLEVRENNLPARILYTGLGFDIIGRRENYYASTTGEREDALNLCLILNNENEILQ